MFKEIAPYVITATVIICAVIAIKINKEAVLTTDGIFAVVGFALGLFITSLNLIYSNNYLITLGPILSIACLLYLRFRNKILTGGMDFNLNFNSKTLKIINILYWVCILVALLSYLQTSLSLTFNRFIKFLLVPRCSVWKFLHQNLMILRGY